MKEWIKSLVQKRGLRLVHDTADPVLSDLLTAYAELRLRSGDSAYWQHRLGELAALGHLRDLLATHRIDCVLDVGANIGQFGRSLRRLGYRGRVVSFEPLDEARTVLEERARTDVGWEVLPLALGAAPAKGLLNIFADDTFSSLHEVNSAGSAAFGTYMTKAGTQAVQVARLEDVWEALFAGRPAKSVLLKTDTQGHDIEVLKGAGSALGKIQAVMAEASVERIYEDSPDFLSLVGFLAAQGFQASGFYPFPHRADTLAMIELNAFFVRP